MKKNRNQKPKYKGKRQRKERQYLEECKKNREKNKRGESYKFKVTN